MSLSSLNGLRRKPIAPALEHVAARPIVCKGSNEDDGHSPTLCHQALLKLNAA